MKRRTESLVLGGKQCAGNHANEAPGMPSVEYTGTRAHRSICALCSGGAPIGERIMMRSLMFVPADSEKKLSKARTSGADALAIDLEESVLPPRKDAARGLMRDWFAAQPDRQGLWVRVNDLASGHLLKDLAAVAPCRPAGILLPKIRGPEDVLGRPL